MTGFHRPASSAVAPRAHGHALRAVALLLFMWVSYEVPVGETARGTPAEGDRKEVRASARQPWTGSGAITVAAVGDGAGSNSNDTRVSDMIVARQPDLFLYLGDVYESGTNPADASGKDGPDGDPDGDGIPNAAERQAGTDPLDSGLALDVWLPLVGNQ